MSIRLATIMDNPAIDMTPICKKDEVLRYIALLASSITRGEGSPAQVNWRYIRDQTMMALAEPAAQPGPCRIQQRPASRP